MAASGAAEARTATTGPYIRRVMAAEVINADRAGMSKATAGAAEASGTAGTDTSASVAQTVGLTDHGGAGAAPCLVGLAVSADRRESPGWLRAELARTLPGLAASPDLAPAARSVAARHGRRAGEVLVTAGTAEALVPIARALRPERAVAGYPQFTGPGAALRAAGYPVRWGLLSPADGFGLTRAVIPEGAGLVVVGNLANRASVLHPATLLAGLGRRERVLVVDEAFMDGVPGEPETLAGPADVPGLLVVRSLTKTRALARLRIGCVLGDPALLERLRGAQPLWTVSAPPLAAARVCSWSAAVAEGDAMARACVEVAGNQRAPFVLIDVADGLRVREGLGRRGFAVLRAGTVPGRGPDWLRVAVREPAASGAFVHSLREALSEELT